MEKNKLTIIVFSIIIAVFFAAFNYFYLSKIITFSSTLYLISVLLCAVPIIIMKFREQSKVKQLEENFSPFLRDFVETTRSGMAIPQAFKAISNNSYGALTPYVKKMASQLDWGISVEKVLINFSKESKSRLIGRIISSVIESHRFGGSLTDTLESLSKTALEVEKLRAERRLYMNSQLITGYIIFFVFLGVMIGLEKFLVPSLGQISSTASLTGLAGTEAPAQSDFAIQYKEVFRNLILIQGLFAGLTVGKMAEGAMVTGLKHSLFMMFVGILVFTIAG
jgi:pilus assembly protein TadC